MKKITVIVWFEDATKLLTVERKVEEVSDILNIVDYRPFIRITTSDMEDRYFHSNTIKEITVTVEELK